MFRAAQLKQLDDSYNLLKVMFLDTTLLLILSYAKIHLLSVRTAAFAARYYITPQCLVPTLVFLLSHSHSSHLDLGNTMLFRVFHTVLSLHPVEV